MNLYLIVWDIIEKNKLDFHRRTKNKQLLDLFICLISVHNKQQTFFWKGGLFAKCKYVAWKINVEDLKSYSPTDFDNGGYVDTFKLTLSIRLPPKSSLLHSSPPALGIYFAVFQKLWNTWAFLQWRLQSVNSIHKMIGLQLILANNNTLFSSLADFLLELWCLPGHGAQKDNLAYNILVTVATS